MSELAHNVNGEPFEVPATACHWRVKRLKSKGAPEVVYGSEGVPLLLPIEAEMADLRREGLAAGRYRLDPIDEHGKIVSNTLAGYVYLHPRDGDEPATTTEPVTYTSRPPTDNVVIEAMRMNAEMARAIVDRFPALLGGVPAMIESAATLLRAADGAGLPGRRPYLFDGEAEDDAAGGPIDAPAPSALTAMIEAFAPIVAPALASAIASGKLQIPGGLGALFDCRRAVPKKPSAPAATARHDASTQATRPSVTDPASAPAAADAAAVSPSAILDPATLGQVLAVYAALTPREAQLARGLVAELTPTQREAWLVDLASLTVPEAVARVRTIAADPAPMDASAASSLIGGAS